jgi:hypothetical protein
MMKEAEKDYEDVKDSEKGHQPAQNKSFLAKEVNDDNLMGQFTQ